MMPILKTSTDTFLGVVNGFVESGRQANVYRLYQRFAMDYLARAVFGIDNNLQEGPERTTPKEATEMLQGKISGTLSFISRK
ncbi:hypothetical protein HPB48_013230 [Haemaphysalis longicornis]|uniref:Uncharacterized protein n=1 Tax=Haemaphysalis longicornis TaxID=44386 RepID=A0A9J6GMD5_HAELO|nr:hypothetical protein HPB48_013230 [Haemaphysalis longicornis]